MSQDHTLGIPQFLRGGQTAILASAAGRDFIESDLAGNGLYRPIGEIAQPWKVTHWAQAFEKLCWPLAMANKPRSVSSCSAPRDLGITILHTPGHTPDQLAWYDRGEMHLYVGDSFYERGSDGMDIIWPPQGNLIEWYFSMQKLRFFVRSENMRAAAVAEEEGDDGCDGWVQVAERVKIGCGHQTADVDGESIMDALETMWWQVLKGKIPVSDTMVIAGETVDRWMEPGGKGQFSFRAPRRLMDDARNFFRGNGLD
jgi:glyoxylase-like metal-dependent hydrolase (beta-lactamase superfamily II)